MQARFKIIISIAFLAVLCILAFGNLTESSSETKGDAASGGGARGDAGRSPGGRAGGGAPTTVVLTPLTLLPYEHTIRAIGNADSAFSAVVTSKGSGEITSIEMVPNSIVEKGDVIAKLDARTQILNVETARVKLEKAQATVARYERLRSSGSSNVSDVTLTEARLDMEIAEVDLGLARLSLENQTIMAPISGKLGLPGVDVGDVISTNTEIVTIDQSDSLIVEFELPESSISLLAEDAKLQASTPTFVGQVFDGEIISYDSRIDSVTKSVTVKARIENTDEELWPGMTFAVRLIHISEPLPTIPSTAITWSREGSSIWVSKDGVVSAIPVTILHRFGETVWIKADIPEGTMVVSEGAHKLREGSKITTSEMNSNPPENGQSLRSPQTESSAQ